VSSDNIQNIFKQVTKYYPVFNDYSTSDEDNILTFSLRALSADSEETEGNISISSNEIWFYYFYDNKNIDKIYEMANRIFSIINNEIDNIFTPLSIRYVEKYVSHTFYTKINHGTIMNDLFCVNTKFSKIVGENKLLEFSPRIVSLLDKSQEIYSEIKFISRSSFRADMQDEYRTEQGLTIFFSVTQNRGFKFDTEIVNIFDSIDNYFDGHEYASFFTEIEKPLFEYLQNE
jgi:hypothetical protein